MSVTINVMLGSKEGLLGKPLSEIKNEMMEKKEMPKKKKRKKNAIQKMTDGMNNAIAPGKKKKYQTEVI